MTAKFQAIVFSGSWRFVVHVGESSLNIQGGARLPGPGVCNSLANEMERQKRFESMFAHARARLFND